MAVDERAAELKKASEQLVRVTQELQKFNESAGVEIAQIVGKDLKKVTDPFVSSIMNIPGVAMLGEVGKSLGNRLFAKMKEKREMEHLRQMINAQKAGVNLSKQEFRQLKITQDVLKAQKEESEKFKQAAESILGIGDEQAKGITEVADTIKKLNEDTINQTEILRKTNEELGIKDMTKELDEMAETAQKQLEIQQGGLRGRARAAEMEGERLRREEKRDTVFESIASGIIGMQDALKNGLANLKDKGLLGLGMLAGLVAAPFIAITAFFTQLGAEVRVLDKLLGGGLGRFFQPLIRFFRGIEDVFSKAGTGQFLKGDTIKIFGRYADDVSRFIGRIKAIFKPLMDAAKSSAGFMAGFQPIAKFAATVGRTLGKIFLPITIFMSIFDAVTGFMDGFKNEDGNTAEKVIAGIREGIISLVDGLIGGLIRLLTGALAFILEFLGLDQFAASIKQNVDEAIEGIYEAFRGVFDIVKGIFTGDFALVGDGIASIFSGVVEVLTAPFDMIYGLIKDVFSFVGFELPDFDLADTILGFVGAAYDFVKSKVKGFFSFLGFGNEEEELEGKSRAADKRLDVAERQVDMYDRAGALDTRGGQNAMDRYGKALDESIAAEEALEKFRNAPKLKDVINTATEKTKEVFTGIGNTVSAGFSSAVGFVTDLFSFSSEDATVAGIATKMIDIVLAPYNLAINFLRGIFGFGEDEQGNVEPFSLGEMIVGVVSDIIDFFKGLFDIDIMGLVNSIPGAGKILSFFGFGGDDSSSGPTLEDQIMNAELERERIQAKIDRGNFGSVGVSDRDERRRVAELEEQIAELQRLQGEQRVQVINNNNVVNANTSNNASTTTIAPMRDTSPPAGSIPAYG